MKLRYYMATYSMGYGRAILTFAADNKGLAWDHALHCNRWPLGDWPKHMTLRKVMFIGWEEPKECGVLQLQPNADWRAA